MERNIDRKTLSFGKGMTNVPSDLLSDDTELAYSRDFMYKDGEIKPILKMEHVGNIGGKIMHVHKMADYENFIIYDEFEEGGTITWCKRSDLKTVLGTFNNIGKVSDIKSVGNTLVVTTDKGLHYLLYKEGEYKDLGTELPIPHFYPTFVAAHNGLITEMTPCSLKEIIDANDKYQATYKDGKIYLNELEGIDVALANYVKYSPNTDEEKTKAFQDAVQGHVAKSISVLKEKNYFMFPFFARYALKLYDGTYARISAPIACFPTIRKNCCFIPVIWDKDEKDFKQTYKKTYTFSYMPISAKLQFKASIDNIDSWKDIVKELVVFASDDVLSFNIDEDWSFKSAPETQGTEYADYIGSDDKDPSSILSSSTTFNFTEEYPAREVILPKYKSDNEIIDELVSKTQFYKLFEIDCNSTYLDKIEFSDAPIKKNVVLNLTVQEQLKSDDYYGWTHMTANKEYNYNNRINLIDVKRFPFKGFNVFTNGNNIGTNVCYYVHIISQSMSAWVKSDDIQIPFLQTTNAWFYYPDTNATEVIIWNIAENKGMRLQLKKHSMLNGAYSFNRLPTENTFVANVTELPTVDENAHETLNSQIFTSVVNNPFVFEASGDNTVGTGSILGIVANTDAISQGQFGQYPLLVFTDEGIYAMGVNSEGLYSNIYPISREVCNKADSITPTDKLIYFTSDKGLMATTGGQVVCVSTSLGGGKNRLLPESILPFKKYLENCLIAYDYKESLLRIFNKNTNYHYVYNMIDKTFSTASNYAGGKVFCRNVVNDYPDNLVQFTDGLVFSLTSIPQREDDENKYDGILKTRPLKLGGSSILKSLRGMKHLFDSDGGTIKVALYGSNDCKTWQKLTSLQGKPWKYFRLEYTLNGFAATDVFAGTIMEVQPRREDKIR